MFQESSFNDLYHNIEIGFPNTGFRQHATNPIEILELSLLPYRGMKTLYVKGMAKNENRIYFPMILFKKVNFDLSEATITASTGAKYSFGKLSLEHTNVLVRCDCKDFRYRFAYYNSLEKSLYGRVPPKYESLGTGRIANPKEVSGFCKHCIKLFDVISEYHIFK